MSMQGVLALAARSAREGIDRTAPLWQLVVVDEMEDGTSAVIEKFHHSLTDGVGGMEFLLSLIDWSRRPASHPRPGGPIEPEREAPFDRLIRPVEEGARAALWLAASAVRSIGRPLEALMTTWSTGQSMVRLLTPGTKRLSPLFDGRSASRLFDTYELAMADLRCAASAADGTVNDVFMAAVTGALYRYHLKLGHEITHLRMNLPVSFRKPDDPVGGNRFTPVRFVVPVDEPDPRKRIRQLGAVCRRWRDEPALPMTENIAVALGRLPTRATTALLASMMYGIDFVATNVPGIDRRCYIAGSELLRQFAFAPLAGAAVNFSLVSHAGTACIGVNMDEASVSDPGLLMACLRDGFDEVTTAIG